MRENLQSQLSEMEVLQSMFPNPGEIKFEDNAILATMSRFLDYGSLDLPPFLDFTVNLTMDEHKIEVSFNLSHEYPQAEPDIFIRANHLSREQHSRINGDCTKFVCELERGEACVYSILDWLRENHTHYADGPSESAPPRSQEEEKLTRLWIYSHHIYNKTKRREIVGLANELGLTGFCLPGKPGIVCVEGLARDCNSWWLIIKSMTWQKILCKAREDCVDPETFRKFENFEEIAFQTQGNRCNHMDMGELNRYLEAHNLQHIFKELFGIDGKS